ncbi:hypothetical protein AB4Y42_20290 [Paraburkholderia sp. EG286B]|uniref:hypothetical protein n=1 Tax=Paraburkholderia sp. EG286B TaxID=3237011 RepID=UPI0034D1B96D
MLHFRRMPHPESGAGHYLSFPEIDTCDWLLETQPRELERIQSYLTWVIGSVELKVASPYALEKKLAGGNFQHADRARFWERVSRTEFRLYAALERGDRLAIEQWHVLGDVTDQAEVLRQSPIWSLLLNDLEPAWQVALRFRETESLCGYPVPRPPIPDSADVARYTNELFPGLENMSAPDFKTCLTWLHMALFCLRYAEATFNLPLYIITFFHMSCGMPSRHKFPASAGILWDEAVIHLTRWARFLRVCPESTSPLEAMKRCEELHRFGITFQAKSLDENAHLQLERPALSADGEEHSDWKFLGLVAAMQELARNAKRRSPRPSSGSRGRNP